MKHEDRGRKRGPVISEAEFRRMWDDMTISVTEIGKRLGITCNAVRQRAEARGFPPRPKGRPFARKHDHDRFADLYLAGLSMPAIANLTGSTVHNVLMALRRAGVKSRDRKDPRTTNCALAVLMAQSATAEQAARRAMEQEGSYRRPGQDKRAA